MGHLPCQKNSRLKERCISWTVRHSPFDPGFGINVNHPIHLEVFLRDELSETTSLKSKAPARKLRIPNCIKHLLTVHHYKTKRVVKFHCCTNKIGGCWYDVRTGKAGFPPELIISASKNAKCAITIKENPKLSNLCRGIDKRLWWSRRMPVRDNVPSSVNIRGELKAKKHSISFSLGWG